jgi:hypothetical protein
MILIRTEVIRVDESGRRTLFIIELPVTSHHGRAGHQLSTPLVCDYGLELLSVSSEYNTSWYRSANHSATEDDGG